MWSSKSLVSLRWCFQLCSCTCINSPGLIWKSETLWDARKHKTGGGVGGGRHTRVWQVRCLLMQRKLKCSTTKAVFQFQFPPKHPRKLTHTLHIQGLILFCFLSHWWKFYSKEFHVNRWNERESISEHRRWMRKRAAGREIKWARGKERWTWFMRPVSGIIESRRDAAEGWGWGVGKKQTERDRGRS